MSLDEGSSYCADCKARYEKRIAELEADKRHTENVMADIGKLNDLLGVYDLCQVVEAVKKWQKRIAELEESQQWHLASEPPKHENKIEGQSKYGNVYTVRWSFDNQDYSDIEGYVVDIIRWRELPPSPETEKEDI